MIEICNDYDTKASKNYMTAEFTLDKEGNPTIGEVKMTKKFNNRMSKQKQRAVKAWLKENAGKDFEVKHNLKIELIFHADKSRVEVTFKESQAKE